MKRRVIAIVRVSTPNQAADDRHGLARQRHDIEQTAAAHDLEIVRWCEVVESGSIAFRGEDFAAVFKDLARVDIHGAIVSSIDRLIRPGQLGDLQVFDPFQRHKKLLFAGGSEIDVESEAGWIVSAMSGLSAGLEKRAILKRTLGGKERMRAKGGHPGGKISLPRGLTYVRERNADGKVVRAYWQYTAESQQVLEAFRLLLAGESFVEIAKRVGFASGRGVASILRNTVWKGTRTFEPNSLRAVPLEMPLGIPPLVSPEYWAQAQVILDQKRNATRALRRQDRTVCLALGVLRCHCGRRLYLRRDYRVGQFDLLYCGSRFPKGVGCGAPSLRRVDADPAIVDVITRHLSSARVLLAILEKAPQRRAPNPKAAAKTEREIARVTADRARLVDLRMKGKITESEFDSRAAELAAELRALEAALPRAAPVFDQKALATGIARLLAGFRFLEPRAQHALARKLFVGFDLTRDGNAIGAVVLRGETVAGEYAKKEPLSTQPSEISVFPDLPIALPAPVMIRKIA